MLPTCATVDSRWPPPRLHPPSARSVRLSSATPRRLVSQHVGSAAGHRQKEAPSHQPAAQQKRLRVAPLQSAPETKAAPVRSPRAAAWCRAAPRRALQRQRQASYISRGSGVLALLQGGGLVHAPQPAAAGPARAAAGAKAQRCALREQRQRRTHKARRKASAVCPRCSRVAPRGYAPQQPAASGSRPLRSGPGDAQRTRQRRMRR